MNSNNLSFIIYYIPASKGISSLLLRKEIQIRKEERYEQEYQRSWAWDKVSEI